MFTPAIVKTSCKKLINGHVMVPKGYEKTAALIAAKGYEIETVDVSEYRKLDGRLSCLSLGC